MVEFSLVIPAYNEEKRIGKTLEAYYKILVSKFGDFEVLVVTDGSNDGTNDIVRDYGKKNKGVSLLSFPNKLGKGGGVLEGFKAAKGKVVGFVDADAAVPPSELAKVIDGLGEGCVAAIASRYVRGAKWVKGEPWRIVVASRVFNVLVNVLFFLGVWDTQCGGKVFRAEAVRKVIPKMISRGFGFDVELLWRVKQYGKIKEIGIVWEHVEEGSQTRLRDFHKILREIIQVRMSKR